MILRYKNNAKSVLATGINTSATTVTVSTGEGSKFPVAGGTYQFYVTISNPVDFTVNEILLCTARSGDTLTVTRAQQGTTAKNWVIGSKVAQWMTAADMENFMQTDDLANIDDPPVGTILPFAGYSWNIPTNWLICNGQYQPTAVYPALYSVLGTLYGGFTGYFAVPDLRGLFIRGRIVTTGIGVDPNRTVGSFQGQAVQYHTHTIPQGYTNGYSEWGDRSSGGAGFSDGYDAAWIDYTSVTGGNYTRPVNMAMHYIIRAKTQF